MTTARPAPAAAFSAAVAWASEWTTITGSRGGPISVEPAKIGGYLDHAVGETPFVVVPSEDSDKALVEHLRLGHVEGRAVRVVIEVDRDRRRLVDAEDALGTVRLRGLFHQCVDLVARSLARRVEFEIDQRHIGGGHADRGAVELALERRQYQADRARRTGRGRDQRLRRGPRPPQVAVQGVLEALVAGIGVDRRHIAALDADTLVQHMGDRREAIGRARRVRDDLMRGLQLLLVDSHNDGHVGAVGRGRNDHPLGAGLEVFGGGLAPGEDAGAFERDIDPELAPRQLGRIALGGDPDLAAADIHPILAGRDLARKAAVNAVVAQEMRIGLDRTEVVDADDLDLGVLVFVSRPQDQPADAAKAVDRNSYRHDLSSPRPWPIYRSERAASATFSGVMPKCGKSASPGAEAPNPVIPIKAPCGPSQRSQPNCTAASTATRGAEPMTASRYSRGACSNSSQHGIETTAATILSRASASRAAIAIDTSEPVASKVTSRAWDPSTST